MSHIISRLSVAAFAAVLALLAAPAVQAKTVCGGIAGAACGKGQYCFYAKGACRTPDMQGVCKVRPKACTREYRPVCGCNGRTYPNACVAASAGMSVLHTGKCRNALKPAPRRKRICGGKAGRRCGRGEYCRIKTGDCRVVGVQGVCRTRPRGCTRELRPVCGCNGRTYPNACAAASAGVNVLHKGKCRLWRQPPRDELHDSSEQPR